jgi:hypothetical protein
MPGQTTEEKDASPLARAASTLSLCFSVPLAFCYVTFFLFRSNYTFGVYAPNTFQQAFSSGVYRYRIVGRELLFAIYGLLRTVYPHGLPARLYFSALSQLDKKPDDYFYVSYILLNFGCLVLFNLVTLRLLRSRWFRVPSVQAFTLVVGLDALICLSFSVLTVYDGPSYVLLVVALWLALRGSTSSRVALAMVVALGVLVRESVILAVAADAALLFFRGGWRRSALLPAAIPAAAYVAAYVLVRLVIGADPNAVLPSIPLDEFDAVVGLLFLGGLLSVVLSSPPVIRRIASAFLLFSIPYLIAIFQSGVLIEVRLYVPVVILCWLLLQVTPEAVRRAESPPS